MRSVRHFLLVGTIVCLAAPGASAQEAADQWERGSDPVTTTSGLHHVATDTYVTCAGQSGLIRVSVPARGDHVIALASGDVKSSVFERAQADGRLYGFTKADDPLYAAVLARRSLSVDGQTLGFSDKDFRYFSLLMRVCKEPSE
jgi:hypothetical protein